MELIPYNWNVILVGFWNKAILIPNFITDKIFKLEKGTQIEVQVPVDLLAAPRIKYKEYIFFTDKERIIIETNECKTEYLIKALEYAKNVYEVLPVTPVIAVGFNIRYKIDNIDSDLHFLTKLN